ncbi:hypothetical protein [Gloeothece verrucosa]|uniref:O-antigen polymerase n=1 Tax=Gloeothece verrucosa (strain PCC 7822) TaxID=497965 RepID=E0UCX9_GLOV7|nr:hypothetical protein [Gloeothece verrucosa]ADN16444.1 conserved hypothetical protein [Gloeothece verrucosa PCC 7822]
MKTENNPMFIALIACAALIVAVGLLFLLRSDGGLQAALLALFIVPCMAISFINPRWGILALLIYLPLSNTLTFSVIKVYKVIGNMIGYTKAYPLYKIAKDGFYFPALLGILISTKTWEQLRPKIKPLLIALSILLGICLLSLVFVSFADFQLQNLVKGLVGLKILLGYIPLIVCGYYLIRTSKDIFFVSRLQVVLILICCSLCFIQYFLLTSQFCPDNITLNKLPSLVPLSQDKYYPDITAKATLKGMCFVGGSLLYNPQQGLIRLPGTFSDPWQWAWFLIFSGFMTYAASFSDPSPRWRVVSWIGMAMVLATTLISGQRVALLVVPVTFIVLLVVSERRKKWLPVKLGIIAALTLLVISQMSFVQQLLSNFIARWQYSPPLEFMTKQLQWLLGIQGKNINLLGVGGLGGATSGARRLVDENATQLIETFYVKLLYEIGILGFLAFMGVVTILSILTFRAYKTVNNQALSHWAICLWIFILFISYNPWYYPLTVEPVAVYYWLFAGILLKLPELQTFSDNSTQEDSTEQSQNNDF